MFNNCFIKIFTMLVYLYRNNKIFIKYTKYNAIFKYKYQFLSSYLIVFPQ